MSLAVVEDMSEFDGNRQFKWGREAGRFDKGAKLDSDMPWLTESMERLHDNEIQDISFQEINPAYVKGYEVGYEEGPQEDKRKKRKKSF